MAKPALEDGARHLGWLYDQRNDTPHHAAVLQRDGQTVTLRIPLAEHVHEVYRRWFGGGIRYGDDPDRTRYAYHPPSVLWFQGPWGAATLVDCYARSWSSVVGGAEEGIIGCSMAVIGATPGVRYETVDAVESAVPGLGLWLERDSLERTVARGADGLPDQLTVSWRREASARLAQRMNLTVHPSFRFNDRIPGDSEVLEGTFTLHTEMARPRPWRQHLNVHRAVPSMMTIAYWHPWGLEGVRLRRADDPERALDGTARGPGWHSAVVGQLEPVDVPSRRPEFLFRFGDIPGSPVTRWLRLQDGFEEPLSRLVRLAHWRRADLVGLVQELGTIVELLGFQIGREEGERPKARFKAQAGRILAQLPDAIRTAAADWPRDFRTTYTAAKHADRETPHQDALWRGVLATRLLLRLWVATRLGVAPDRLVPALRTDQGARASGWRIP